MTYTTTARKGDSTGYDACCGESILTMTDDTLPESHKENGILYVYTRCQNCGATWRDGFKDGYTKTNHTPFDDSATIYVETDELDYEVSHVDTNKAHQGRVDLVKQPTEHPLKLYRENDWADPDRIEEEWDLHSPENYERRETWVYRFTELDTSTIPSVAVGETYLFDHPALKPVEEQTPVEVILKVTDLEFDQDYSLSSISYQITHCDVSTSEVPILSGTKSSISESDFLTYCELIETIKGRPHN